MARARSCTLMALLLAALALPVAIAAQATADRTAIAGAALSAWEHALRSKQCAYCSAQLILEPLVLRGRWDHGVRADTTPPRRRDSLEIASLAAALRGAAATAELASACSGSTPKPACPMTFRTGRSVAISDPHVVGDTATLLLRDAGLNLLGNDRAIGGMTLAVSLVRVVRVNGTWTAQCIVHASGDSSPPPAQVEARCVASAAGKGG